jgi:general secretion pathway protein J
VTEAFRLPSHAASGEGGFTLLEIMVGLLVSVMIMAGLTVAMKSMSVGWQSTVNVLGKQDSFADGFHIIAGDISRIERVTDKIDKPEQFLFRGGPLEAIFPLSERAASNQEGLYWIRLFVRTDDSGTQLVRMRAPFESRTQDLSAIAWRDPVVLLSGNFVIGFSYRAPRGGFSTWMTSWTMPDRLPEQVRVDVSDAGSGELVMPPLIQALENNAETVCIDPKSAGCTLQTQGQLVPKPTNESTDPQENQ